MRESMRASSSSTAYRRAFWYDATLPESVEATDLMAGFLMTQVSK
jgi:hypothetical protein